MMLPCTNLAGFTGESSGILGFEESSDGTGMSSYIALFQPKEPVGHHALFGGTLEEYQQGKGPSLLGKSQHVRVSLTLPVELSG